MNKAILSFRYPEYAQSLKNLGYEVIPSETVERFIPYERDHADMQCLIMDNTAFVLESCGRLADILRSDYNVITCGEFVDGKYPMNVPLNAAVTGDHIIAKSNSLDKKVVSYSEINGYKLIDVNQGYAKCSCAIVSDNALITADKGIYRALRNTDIDAMLIGQGSIRLCGAEYGFIGGASGYDKETETLYLCGDIKTHPDYEIVKEFCNKYNTKTVSLTPGPLTDIGGIIFC